MFPKILHLCCKDKNNINETYQYCYDKYKEIYLDYEIKLYDHDDMYNIIAQNFPDDLNTVKQIKIGAILADIFRYLILYLEGGIYSDMDCEPLKSIDTLFCEAHYHGDINRDNQFYIYPKNMDIINNKWDYYENPCNNCIMIKNSLNVKTYKCFGHSYVDKNTNIILCKENHQFYDDYNNIINNNRLCIWYMITKPNQDVFLECYKEAIQNIKQNYNYIQDLYDNINVFDNKTKYMLEVFHNTGPIFFTKKINSKINDNDSESNNGIVLLPCDFFCAGSGSDNDITPLTSNSYVKHHFNSSWYEKQINKKPTFCFATMCKNEEHCILETLESVYKYCDYWVICDTGSTDNTCSLITNFFKEKNIPGELHIDEWKGFGYNKTLLFQRCYNKTDYIIHCDADDLLMGEFDFTSEDAGHLAYEVTMKRGGATYTNLVIFNNRFKWKICGNAHTIARCLDNNSGLEMRNFSHKKFYVWSRDTGARSNDAEKYHKDAIILRQQFFDTLIDDEDGLNSRSVFYTAQSYMDSGNFLESLKWYCLYTKLKHTWEEEIFECYLRIATCFMKLENEKQSYSEKIIFYLNLAIELFGDRAEPYFELGEYYFKIGDYYQAFINFKIARNKDYEIIKKKYTLFVNQYCYGENVEQYINKCLMIL